MSEVLAELDAADLPPDHPRKQLEATLEVNRVAFESLPQWARDACSTGVFAPHAGTNSNPLGAEMFAPDNAEDTALAAARIWAQNDADNDGRRYLADAMREHGPEAYAAACVLADLGPNGSNASRADRESSLKILIKSMRTATGEVLAHFEVVGEDDDKSLRGWTKGDKQESTHDELVFVPHRWEVGIVVEVRSAET